MLIVCNGAQKGGSTWVYNLARLIKPDHQRIPVRYQENGYRSSSIARNSIAAFVSEVDFKSVDFVCKQHWTRRAAARALANDCNTKFIDIIRDIRDVAVSRYYHDVRLGNIPGEISFNHYILDRGFSMINHYVDYQFYWHRDFSESDVEPLLLSYEGLKLDFRSSFMLMAEYLGSPVTDVDIEHAQEKTDIKNLQGLSHYRKGIIGDWIGHFYPETAEVFESHLKSMGYLDFLVMAKGRGVYVADDLINGNWSQICRPIG
jgi:hypothetical protein